MIIGVTGTYAAGKGTIVDFLKKQGFEHFSVSGYITEEIKKRNMPVNRDSMIKVANDLRTKYGSSYIVEKLYNIAAKKNTHVIIESLRTIGEVEALKQKNHFVLFAIDADIKIRYKRALKRESSKDNITFEEFEDRENKEMHSKDPNKQNIAACMKIADHTFLNNGSLEDLHKELEEVLGNRLNKKNQFNKREGFISWDNYFMGIAKLSGLRSKDPNTQVGACIVNERNRIIGIGYNGFPKNCNDELLPWNRAADCVNDTKYPYVVHAEANAILNSQVHSFENCRIYVLMYPCNECAKLIIQSGIKEVIYLFDKYPDHHTTLAAKKMFMLSGTKIRQYTPKNKELCLKFDKI